MNLWNTTNWWPTSLISNSDSSSPVTILLSAHGFLKGVVQRQRLQADRKLQENERRHLLYLPGWRCRAAQPWSCHRCCKGGATRAAGSAWDLWPLHRPHQIPPLGPTQRTQTGITKTRNAFACLNVQVQTCVKLPFVNIRLQVFLRKIPQQLNSSPSWPLMCCEVNTMMWFRDWTRTDLLGFTEFFHVVREMLHAVLSQLQVDGFLEFTQKKNQIKF